VSLLVEKDLDEGGDAPLGQHGWAFHNDPYAALEEVRKIISISQEELDMFLAVLAKSYSSQIDFEVGNVRITFLKPDFYSDRDPEDYCLELRVEIKEEKVTHVAMYHLKRYSTRKIATVDDE
jgi:hypothetical protein